MKALHYFLLTLFLLSTLILSGQSQNPKQADRMWLLGAQAGLNFPAGEWTDRYGQSFSNGANVGRKFRSNLILSLEGEYLFGGEVPDRQNALRNVFTDNGNLINTTGNYAVVNINQRGTHFHLSLEKLFPKTGPNLNSGLGLGLGAGYGFYWLNIDNVNNDSPQILDEYKKGYDRLSSGFSLKQNISYLYLSPNRMINFKLSFEVSEIWTQDLRKYYYPTGLLSSDPQLNFMYSLKLKWYIPIYLGGVKEEYYLD